MGKAHRGKFTRRNRERLIARVELGMTFAEAAEASGQKLPTVKGWLARGRRERTGPYADFARAVEEARAGAPALRGPMDAAELEAVVSELGRRGSVRALRLRWQQLRAEARKSTTGKPPPRRRRSGRGFGYASEAPEKERSNGPSDAQPDWPTRRRDEGEET